jgi:hypothetical protein
MAQQVYAFTVTCPAGTSLVAAITQDVSFPQADVNELQIVIPDGHAGLTGIAVQQAHQAVIPKNAGAFLVTNDEKLIFPLQDYLDNGNWQVVMYNTDIYPHSWYLRFLCTTLGTQPQSPVFNVSPPPLALPAVDLAAIDAGVAAGTTA